MSSEASTLCRLRKDDRVMLTFKNDVIIKEICPVTELSVTSVCLSKTYMELSKISGQVKVQKFIYSTTPAKTIIVNCLSKQLDEKLSCDLEIKLRERNKNKTFCIGNRTSIRYDGKHLIFKIINIIEDGVPIGATHFEKKLEKIAVTQKQQPTFYESLYSTTWTIVDDEKKPKAPKQLKSCVNIQDLGIDVKLLEDLKRCFESAFGICNKKSSKSNGNYEGVLLHGPVGVGKKTIVNSLLANYDVNIFKIKFHEYLERGGKKLEEIFDKAKKQSPSAIIIEDIETLCSNKLDSSGEKELKCLMSMLLNEIDGLSTNDSHILLLITSSEPDSINSKLLKPRRIDRKFEVFRPTSIVRRKILNTLLSKYSNNINNDELDHISFNTHGYIAADLYYLCRKAEECANSRINGEELLACEINISASDFNKALKLVKPMVMKEYVIEIPNVTWSDIGGGEILKCELKKIIEWPLKFDKTYKELEIKRPGGVLMYGPPGCSKTMVAKAIANEIKVNFMNIKVINFFVKLLISCNY